MGPVLRVRPQVHERQRVMSFPLPKHGVNINNRVVYSLCQTFAKKGFSTLRFNFRGVGRSEGAYDNGEGELADAAAAMDWLQSTHPQVNSFWVAGFSFGAWIAMQLLMRRPELDGFIALSPPTNMYDFYFLAPCPVSGQIIHGEQDAVVPYQYTDALVQKLRSQKGIAIDYQVLKNNLFVKLVYNFESFISSSINCDSKR